MHELSQAPALQFKERLIVFIVVTKNDVTDAGGQSIPAMRPFFLVTSRAKQGMKRERQGHFSTSQ